MWFDEKNKELEKVRNVIKTTVKDCGFFPILIDEKEHNNQIVPEIFYEIERCVFMIADLTGQRNGVYYEAGYAKGCGRPVILTCKKSDNKRPHFDVKQQNTIFYDGLSDLSKRLKDRITSMNLR